MVDSADLRQLVSELEHAEGLAQAESALVKISRLIDLPVVAWCPDVCDPHYNPHVNAFMLRNGWPEKTIRLWWERHVMMKHPLYLNCRIHSLPFVCSFRNVAAPSEEVADVRKINNDVLGMKVKYGIVIPVRMPRGQVAMVFFGGHHEEEETATLLDRFRTELITAGLYFMLAFRKETGIENHDEQLLSKLTIKQWECLRLSAQGYRENEIAEIMGIVTPTVRFHLKNAVTNIGASTRSHAIAIAAQLGMLGPISI